MVESWRDRLCLLEAEVKNKRLVIISDVEGPILLGDTAMQAMSEFVRPKSDRKDIDYGGMLYSATYEWFNAHYRAQGIGEEGSDIALCIVPLLAMGVTDDKLFEVAERSRPMHGFGKLSKYVADSGGCIIGLTTAWEAYHRDLLVAMGVMEVFGTTFSLDSAYSLPLVEKDLAKARNYLKDCFAILEEGSGRQLEKRIRDFYVSELNLNYDRQYSIQKSGLVQYIENDLHVVGDISKRDLAIAIASRADPSAFVMALGDGLNDVRMLESIDISVGINGPDAAKAGFYNLLTHDVSILVDFLKCQKSSQSSDALISEFNQKHPGSLGDRSSLTQSVLEQHSRMRAALKKGYSVIP